MSSAQPWRFTLSQFMLLLIPLSALMAFIGEVGIPAFLVGAILGLTSGAGVYVVASSASAFTPPDMPLSRRGLSLATRRRYKRFRTAAGGAVGILVTVSGQHLPGLGIVLSAGGAPSSEQRQRAAPRRLDERIDI